MGSGIPKPPLSSCPHPCGTPQCPPGPGKREWGAISLSQPGAFEMQQSAYLEREGCVGIGRGPAGPGGCRGLGCEGGSARLVARPSVDVCAQSHCSISALGCAPPSPPSFACALPRSPARSLPKHHAAPWRRRNYYFIYLIFFFFSSPSLSFTSSRGEGGRAERLIIIIIIHNSSRSLSRLLCPPAEPPEASSVPGAGSGVGLEGSEPLAVGWEQPQSLPQRCVRPLSV